MVYLISGNKPNILLGVYMPNGLYLNFEVNNSTDIVLRIKKKQPGRKAVLRRVFLDLAGVQ